MFYKAKNIFCLVMSTFHEPKILLKAKNKFWLFLSSWTRILLKAKNKFCENIALYFIWVAPKMYFDPLMGPSIRREGTSKKYGSLGDFLQKTSPKTGAFG